MLKKNIKIKSNKQKPSPIMNKLYGDDFALTVSDRLEELDPELHRLIQEIPYEIFWKRDGLSLKEKALITVSALIAMGKEEQIKIHMRGFLNSGGTEEELKNTLLHLTMYCGFPAAMNGFNALKEVLKKNKES